MTFDPFGDFATAGYLRNTEREKDLNIVKRMEHSSFVSGLDQAFAELRKPKQLTYEHVLRTHGILFDAVYPWAGLDRLQTAPKLSINKGPVIFANPLEIRPAVDFALHKGQDKEHMRAKPGEIMGYLAYGHPFLDGNGRTIITVYSVLSQRAGFSIDWISMEKGAYLDVLTKEIEAPNSGYLDSYLRRFMRDPIAYDQLATEIVEARGLDGSAESSEFNEVLGDIDEPAVKARYEAMLTRRKRD
jgi:cell filamentation protein